MLSSSQTQPIRTTQPYQYPRLTTEQSVLDKSGSTLDIQEDQLDTLDEESSIHACVAADVLAKLISSRRRFLFVLGAGVATFSIIALLIPNRFSSMAQLMPPDPRVFVSDSVLTPSFGQGLAASGLLAGELNEKTPSSIAIGIMTSPRCLDDIIDRLDLRHVYHVKLYRDARKELSGKTKITEDRKTGIITVAVEDRDKYRALRIAQAYIDELNNLLNNLNVSTAHRERVFLEERLKGIKESLDNATKQMGEFSSRSGALDLTKQGDETMQAVGRLQGELYIAESNLSALKMSYTADNARVRQAQGRVDSLQSELQKMTGNSALQSGARGSESSGGLPSVRQLPLLGVKYYDLYRKVTLQEAIYETLSKQYETAKVEEAEELPVVKVLTPPEVAEMKSFPPRKTIVLAGTILVEFSYIFWLVCAAYWKYADELSPIKGSIVAVIISVRQSWLQRHVAASAER